MLQTQDTACQQSPDMLQKINAKLVGYQTRLGEAKDKLEREHIRSRIIFWLKQAELANKWGQRKN